MYISVLTGRRNFDIESVTNITSPNTVDSSNSKVIISRTAQSSDGGIVGSHIALILWTHEARRTAGHIHLIV